MVKITHIEEPSIRYRTVKYFLSLFCFLYLCQGFVTMIVLIWLTVQRLSACDFTSHYFTANYLLLAASVICTVTGILGIIHVVCGKNEHNLKNFMIVVCGIIILECASAVVSDVHLRQIYDGHLLTVMMSTFFRQEQSDCVSTIQSKLLCCGVNNYTDYVTENATEKLFSSNCLCTDGTDCFVYSYLQRNISVYESGCHSKMHSKLESQLVVYRIIGPVVAALQFVLFILTVYIVIKIHSSSMIGAYMVDFDNHERPKNRDSHSVNLSSVRRTADDAGSSHM